MNRIEKIKEQARSTRKLKEMVSGEITQSMLNTEFLLSEYDRLTEKVKSLEESRQRFVIQHEIHVKEVARLSKECGHWKNRAETAEAKLAGYQEAEQDGQLHIGLVAFGQHLWQAWNGEEVREWAVDMIQMLHCGDCYIGCVDIIDGEYGEDYEVFDAGSLGDKLKLTREEAKAALQNELKTRQEL